MKKSDLSKRNTSTRYKKKKKFLHCLGVYQIRVSLGTQATKGHETVTTFSSVTLVVFKEQPLTILEAIHGICLNVGEMDQTVLESFQL